MCMDDENMFHARTAVLTDVGQIDSLSFLTISFAPTVRTVLLLLLCVFWRLG